MPGTEQSETVKTEALENNTGTPAQPQGKSAAELELERLRKEHQQIEMERNQLRNKLEAEEAAKAAAKAKELEEQNEFKTLFEQEKAKREALENERQEEARRKELGTAQATILAEYDDDVKGLAEDAGITLSDTSDEAAQAYKEKLEKLQTRLGKQKVQPNNPGVSSEKKTYSQEEMRQILNDPVKRDQYYREQGGVTAAMMGK